MTIIEGINSQFLFIFCVVGFFYALWLSWQLRRSYQRFSVKGKKTDLVHPFDEEKKQDAKKNLDDERSEIQDLLNKALEVKEDLKYYLERSEKVLGDMEPAVHTLVRSSYQPSLTKTNATSSNIFLNSDEKESAQESASAAIVDFQRLSASK